MPAEGKINADRQQQVLTPTAMRSSACQPMVGCKCHIALHRDHILSTGEADSRAVGLWGSVPGWGFPKLGRLGRVEWQVSG